MRLRGGGKRVLLTLVDSVTGLIWGMVVVGGEETAASWQKLFERAQEMGLLLEKMSGLTSDGAQGLLYLREALPWVHHQRCVWHVWRNLAGDLATAVARATKGLAENMAKTTAETVRRELTALLHAVIDASGYEQAEPALAQLKAHPFGGPLAKKVNEQFDHLLYPLLACHQGLVRIAPEWLWRDFRSRLSRGRNHGCRGALRAGRAPLGCLSRLHARAEEARAQTTLQTSWSKSPRSGRRGARGHQLPGRPERMSTHGWLALALRSKRAGKREEGALGCLPADPISHQPNLQPSRGCGEGRSCGILGY